MDIIILIFQILAIAGIIFLAMFKKNYFPKYLEEKAKNAATKEDIEEITSIIENIKYEYNENLEILKAELKTKDSQIKALRDGALTGVLNRQTSIYNRQLNAIDELWSVIVELIPAKGISSTLSILPYEEMAPKAEKDQRFRDLFSDISNFNMEKLPTITNKALKTKPFLSILTWAYYSAYEAILIDSVAKHHMLKSGINIGTQDFTHASKLIKIALPHQKEYIDKYGSKVFHNLLNELENNILTSFEITIEGKELDKDALKKASEIIKETEIFVKESNKT